MRRGGQTGSRVVLTISWGLLLASVSIMTAEEPAPRYVAGQRPEAVSPEAASGRVLAIAPGRSADSQLPEPYLAVSSAHWLYDTLTDPRLGQFSKEASRLLVGHDAVLPNIRQEAVLLQRSRGDDLVVVFLAGYVGSEGGKVYWFTRETEVGRMDDTALSEAELGLLIEAIPSRHVLVVLDAYDASLVGSSAGVTRADLASVLPGMAGEGRAVLAVEHVGGWYLESQGVRHSVLPHFFVAGLAGAADGNGDGSISAAELWRYLEYQLAQEADRESDVPKPKSMFLVGRGFQPEGVFLTTNPHPEATSRKRLESLLKLLGQGRISGSEYDEGRRLLTTRLLREVERQQREVYADLAGGRTDVETARIALSAIVTKRTMDNSPETRPTALPASLRNSLRMDMVLVPEGSFRMGSSMAAEDLSMRFGGPASWFDPEFPEHPVRISRPLYMSTCEVTVGRFRVFVEETGYRTDAEKGGQSFESGKRGGYSLLADRKWGWRDEATWRRPGFDQTEDDPVVMVSWNDADMFCKWLSARDNRDYRLPSEAEWEYSCRAGKGSMFWWGEDFDQRDMEEREETKLVSWSALTEGHTRAVGRFRANTFGLHDMAGSVWEWCNDWYDRSYYAGSPSVDPQGPPTGMYRVIRGGARHDNPRYCRSSCRNGYRPAGRHGLIGFRIVTEAK